VQSINGLEGTSGGGRSLDWFFYVNGIESPIGSAQYDLSDGDRIWWDYRDWTSAMRVPAVVGAWPEPFVDGFKGERWQTKVVCGAARVLCAEVGGRLEAAGVHAAVAPGPNDAAQPRGGIQVIVGAWNILRANSTTAMLASGPDRSGVFARF